MTPAPGPAPGPAPEHLPEGPSWDALRHHGDAELVPGGVDFAVNVRGDGPPAWLRERLASRLGDLGGYPTVDDDEAAVAAVAARHGVGPDGVLLLGGAAEGFHLIADHAARRGLHAAVVHPSFTEPEVELRRAGVGVDRVILPPPYRLDPALVPDEADLVVVGNPTNPTSVLHPRDTVAALCRPGRVTVVDEAFCDVVSDEAGHTLAGAGLPGLVVLRSLTKTWALAGLRVGYAVGDPAVLADLATDRPHWPLGTLQLEAVRACLAPAADRELETVRAQVVAEREAMVAALETAGIPVVVPPEAPFVLVRTPAGMDPVAFRAGLARRGIATRRGDTFPGLDATYLRLAVRDGRMVAELVRAWRAQREGDRR
ncbi:Rv2231c family pyridoxal phosphate-dependent protein CobC [Dietzia psychralcaliphila]|uniref:Rv2231c family pyridoxal phosphate-dependent protein CobC n=1 Tax=Dietzia psychralcaliphila TaxID=139021 RepID=UPI000D2F717D|nr:Rv2231c family pyridoxal phosphate-dependent protein CobC [Dietzia psychralcaliphila]PTM87330.1 histidinol-phosphate aminotransferase [Dietzia psychralcaliphila]